MALRDERQLRVMVRRHAAAIADAFRDLRATGISALAEFRSCADRTVELEWRFATSGN